MRDPAQSLHSGSDTTDPSVRLCRPAYAEQNVAEIARDTVQTVADSNGIATAVVQLIAKESHTPRLTEGDGAWRPDRAR